MFIDQPVRGPFKIQYAYFTDLYPARVTHPCLRECTNIECDAVILQFKCLCFSGALMVYSGRPEIREQNEQLKQK